MNWKLQEQRCVQNQIWSTSSLILPFAFSLTCGDIFRYHLPTWFHAKIIGFKQSWTRVLICPYPGVKISVFTSGLSSTLHRFFNTIIWMLQEFILLYSLFQRMLCHLLIAKRTWTYKKNWTYMKKKSYFKLFLAFLLYLFSCIRIFFVGGKKKTKSVFFISAKNLFSSFLYNFDVLSETLKSNMMMMMIMFPVTVSACCLCCLNDGCIPLWPIPDLHNQAPTHLPTPPPPIWPHPLQSPSHLMSCSPWSSPDQSSPVQSIKQCFLCLTKLSASLFFSQTELWLSHFRNEVDRHLF